MFAVRAQICSKEGDHLAAVAFLACAVPTSRDKGDVPMFVTVAGYGIQIFMRTGAPFRRSMVHRLRRRRTTRSALEPAAAGSRGQSAEPGRRRRALGPDRYQAETTRGVAMNVDESPALSSAIDDYNLVRDRSS